MTNRPCTQALTAAEDLTTSQYWCNEWRSANDAPRPRQSHARPHPLPSLIARSLERRAFEPIDILEVGCAPGTILSQLAMLRPHDRYHGVDFSHLGLVETQRLLASRSVRATLHRCDIRDFEPGQKYGLVYSCGLIEHFADPAVILQHHVRLCAPGGFVFASVPNYAGRLQQWFINHLDPDALKSHNLQIMKIEALHQAFANVGLRGIAAGCHGPCLIRSRTNRRSLRANVLRRVAQSWNLANAIGPRLSPWRSIIWACGTVT